MTDTFAEYTARMKAGDQSVFLGQLVWYSVSDLLGVSHADVVKIMHDLGIDEALQPKAPKDIDVFRRVCTQNQRKRQPTAIDSIFENLLMRDVKRSGQSVVKHLVVETVNSADETLGYTPAVALTFKTGSKTIDVETLDSALADSPSVRSVVAGIEADFKAQAGQVNGYAIRETIRHVLLDARATAVRSGVHFVMQSEAYTVHNLNLFCSRIRELPDFAPGTELTFHALPLIDDKAQREMLRSAFTDETVEQVLRDLAMIEDVLAGPPITSARAGDMLERMKGVKEKTIEYEQILDDSLDTLRLQLAVYETKMIEVLDHQKDT